MSADRHRLKFLLQPRSRCLWQNQQQSVPGPSSHMRKRRCAGAFPVLATIMLLWMAPPAYPQRAVSPEIVDVPSGELHLKAYLWTPEGAGPFPAVLFNHGSGGADPQHTAGLTLSETAEILAPIFLKHGYAFLYPCRRGQGLSADQAPYIQDLLKKEESARGAGAREHLHYVLATSEQLDDVLAALSFLRSSQGIDHRRIGVIGHSFGGILTLLAGERNPAVRAEVTFGAGANSWKLSAELRQRLLRAVDRTTAPIMLIHAANDYDTAPGASIAAEMDHIRKVHLLKIYPAIGHSADDGHNFIYLGIAQWEPEVLKFLDDSLKR